MKKYVLSLVNSEQELESELEPELESELEPELEPLRNTAFFKKGNRFLFQKQLL